MNMKIYGITTWVFLAIGLILNKEIIYGKFKLEVQPLWT